MAKVKSPLYSLDARGNFWGRLHYSKQKGTNYVKRINKLPTTTTPAQLAWRQHYKDIWDHWWTLTGGEQAGMNFIAYLARTYSGLWWYSSGRHAYLFYVLEGKYSYP